MNRADLPTWQQELRKFLCGVIREQVSDNVLNREFLTVFPRRPSDFVERQTAQVAEECWALFPAWHTVFDATHFGGPIEETWGTLETTDKMVIATNFKDYCYRARGLHGKK